MQAWQISRLKEETERIYGKRSLVMYYRSGNHCYVDIVASDNRRTISMYQGASWDAVYESAHKDLSARPNEGAAPALLTAMPVSVATETDVPGIEGSTPLMQLQYDNARVGQMLASDELNEFQAEARRVYGDDVTVRVQNEPLSYRASVMRGEITLIEWCRVTHKEAINVAIARLSVRPSLDGVNAQRRANVSQHKETTPVTTPTAPKTTLKETMTADATEAAWRVAGSQLAKTVREPLVAVLSRNLAPDDDAVRGRIAAFLETELGVGILSGVISAGISAIPAPAGSPAEVLNSRLARELRVKSMATVGDALADVLAGPLREVAATYLRGVPEAVSVLPESTRITDVAFDPSTTAAAR